MLKKALPAKKGAPVVKKSPFLEKAVALKKVAKKVLPAVKKVSSPKPKVDYPLFYYGNTQISSLKNFARDLGHDEQHHVMRIETGENTKFTFQFAVSSSTYCCGFIELGSFEMPYYRNEEQTEALIKLFEEFGKHSDFQLFACTIEDGCQILEDALEECENWTKVKTFDNPNSNNQITLWVSNK